jgi:hypothetical protein
MCNCVAIALNKVERKRINWNFIVLRMHIIAHATVMVVFGSKTISKCADLFCKSCCSCSVCSDVACTEIEI